MLAIVTIPKWKRSLNGFRIVSIGIRLLCQNICQSTRDRTTRPRNWAVHRGRLHIRHALRPKSLALQEVFLARPLGRVRSLCSRGGLSRTIPQRIRNLALAETRSQWQWEQNMDEGIWHFCPGQTGNLANEMISIPNPLDMLV